MLRLVRLRLALPLVLAAACSGSEEATPDPSSIPTEAGTSATEDGGAPIDPGGADASADASPGEDASLPPDPCAAKKAACPTTTTTEGAGLTALDRCAFPMKEAASFGTYPALVTALETIGTKSSVAAVLGDLNRTGKSIAAGSVPGGPAGVSRAFGWDDEDDASTTWTPQGITGSADADATGLVNGKRVVVVSWYHDTKGVRLAFADVTNAGAPKYRLVLLVEPKGTTAAPTFAPVVIHAGGIVWFGDLLYVADTGRGFRVFDFSRILQVATDVDEIGCTGGTCRGGLYKYVVPQIGAYGDTSACNPIYSFVSLDRSTSPPSLLSGEYCSTSACAGPLAGRVFRWPLASGSKLRPGTSWPSEVFLMGHKQVQGAASRDGLYFFSSSAPAAAGGALYRVKGKKSATSGWIDTPEDLMVDEKNALLWSLSEGANARAVIGAKLASYPAP